MADDRRLRRRRGWALMQSAAASQQIDSLNEVVVSLDGSVCEQDAPLGRGSSGLALGAGGGTFFLPSFNCRTVVPGIS